jgi:hypothetical protein
MKTEIHKTKVVNPLTPNDPYRGRTAPLTSKSFILYIYSTNIGTEYLNTVYTLSFFPLQNAVCFIILFFFFFFLFTFCIQDVLKLKKNQFRRQKVKRVELLARILDGADANEETRRSTQTFNMRTSPTSCKARWGWRCGLLIFIVNCNRYVIALFTHSSYKDDN